MADPASAWVDAGFSVTQGRIALGRTVIETDCDGQGICSVAIQDLAEPIQDLPIVPAELAGPREGASTAPPHSNGIDRIDHLVLLTGDVDKVAALLGQDGLQRRRTRHFGRVDSRRQDFYWLGDVILEVAGPSRPKPQPEPHFWGLALVARNLNTTCSYFGSRISPPTPAVQTGRHIATIDTTALGISVPLAVMTAHD